MYLQQRDAELCHRDRKAEHCRDVEDVERPLGEVQEVQGGVEDLVASAHEEEDGAGGVVDAHHGVGRGVVELVARLALKKKTMEKLLPEYF